MKEYAHEFADIRMQVPSDLQRSGGLYVLRSGYNRAKPGYDVGPKRIECYSLHFIRSGRLCLEDKGSTHELYAGQLFVLFPHVTYRYYIAENSPELSLSWLAMGGPQAAATVEALGLTRSRPSMPVQLDATLRALLSRIHDSMGGRPYQQLSDVYALLELLQLAREQALGQASGQASRQPREQAPTEAVEQTGQDKKLPQQRLIASTEHPRHGEHLPQQRTVAAAEQQAAEPSGRAPWLDYCARYMQLHYAEPLRVDALAAEVGIHRSHFSFAFRERFGTSPKAYLTKLRMTKALELIRADRLSLIQEIALTVGYPDLFTFTRAFTRYYGMSPTEARMK
ncbi:AraC family transcriptional regulator [Paenibacillus sp. YYML68]|uniref:AraC family transcriptional regulator n=1 Tax=Paenibacillus sp. YYML68 TaxID=2909250 RepID=UPI0024903B78|nr:AraC family transcriptional regulator [Paenibacillus sp. YYML68]